MTTTPSDPPLLANVEDELLDMWAEYHDGEWTLERPKYPGVYQIATLEGDYVGLRELRLIDGKIVDRLVAVNDPGWCGFWYSMPLPPPPKEVPMNVRRLH